MVSNLFPLPLEDPPALSAEIATAGHAEPVREYLVGAENALLGHVVATEPEALDDVYPILLFGPAGVGKSHLLRGLVDRYRAGHQRARICLQSAADFCRDISHAHEVGSLSDLRRGFRLLDCLALDDLHQLSEKLYAQQELLHLLDTLHDRQARIWLTSRVSPGELPFCEALTSRLAGGLTVPIRAPGPETKGEFLRQFARELDVDLPHDVLVHLADTAPALIPQLRGLLLRLQQVSADRQVPIDVALASEVTQQRAGENVPEVRRIIKAVARYFGLTAAELTGPSRRQTTVLARDMAIFLTRQLRRDSFDRIGSFFGGRDHSTVMHAFQKIVRQRREPLVNSAITELLQRLGMQDHNV